MWKGELEMDRDKGGGKIPRQRVSERCRECVVLICCITLSLLPERASIRTDILGFITANAGIILIRKAGINLFVGDCDGHIPPHHVHFWLYNLSCCVDIPFTLNRLSNANKQNQA